MASITLKSFTGLRHSSPENHHSTTITTLPKSHHRRVKILASKSSPKLTGRNLRVAVVGGGPAGGAAAETLAKGGIETILIERKMDNAKPCGGAIPLCMVGEFDLPLDIIDRRVTKIIKIPDDKMQYYENLAEMYVGDDVSPDFYGWVFPKCDHVAVGTGTVTHKPDIKKFQLATRLRARDKILGGKIIRVEAHPIPEHPRPRRLAERVALVGDAAGYVTKCSGEGIYFAAKSGRMCAEAIVEGSENGTRMVEEADLRKYLEKWDKTYWPTYKVLDILQKVFYRSNPAREAFVEMCADEYVQKMTFDSYLYKKVAPGNPLEDLKLAVNTIGSLVRANALRNEMAKI
ncbi:Geranylgeranyl diphosphate reductase [Helianthus debilis subsp. tardiflorus]